MWGCAQQVGCSPSQNKKAKCDNSREQLQATCFMCRQKRRAEIEMHACMQANRTFALNFFGSPLQALVALIIDFSRPLLLSRYKKKGRFENKERSPSVLSLSRAAQSGPVNLRSARAARLLQLWPFSTVDCKQLPPPTTSQYPGRLPTA